MTFKEMAKEAAAGDAQVAKDLVDHCRFQLNLNYVEIYDWVHDMTGIGRPEWETILYEADDMVSEAA